MQATKPSPSLIALKPRQVALLSSDPTMKTKQGTGSGSAQAQAQAQSLSPHQKSLLLLSIAHFLRRNSFSKTLKKFLSEAHLEKDDLASSSLDLEEMFCKYLAMSDHSSLNLNREQVQGQEVGVNPNSDEQLVVETTTKKKKKKGNEKSADAIAGQSEEEDKSANSRKTEEQDLHEASKAPSANTMGGLLLDTSAKKEKEKKKKSKLDTESHVENVKCYSSNSLGGESEKQSKVSVSTENNSVSDAGIESKTKDKKKKKSKLTSDSFVDSIGQHGSENNPHAVTTLNTSDTSLEDKTSKSKKKKKKDDSEDIGKEKSSRMDPTDNKNRISEQDPTVADDKVSKKRKRLGSEVNGFQHVEETATEDSKRRKTENQHTKLNSSGGADEHVGKENNGEIGEFENKPAKQLHEQEDGNTEVNGKNSGKKSLKKQQNGSDQLKKPFQRVNVDDVVFVDKRLEDNSYWAKDGAETGYGAKAQEVLGQVRGRDFRHEKTKKKRGSYRGGLIDLHSHSVKFNYSDDEYPGT